MRIGKVSENVLKRSVLRQIHIHGSEVADGAGIGKDCAVLSFADGTDTVLATTPVSAPADKICAYAIPMALNNIAAAGAVPAAVMLSVLFPEQAQEDELRRMMEDAQAVCSRCHVDIAGGHTEIVPGIGEPIVTVTGVGRRIRGSGTGRTIGAGQDIVISKWIGLEGTARLAGERRQELLARYPAVIIDEAAGFDRYLSVIPEAAAAVKSGVCGMHDVSRGGIFGALWELAQGAGVGLEIDLKKIPVRQETVEICEFFELNPYELLSGGCLLMAADHGDELAETLEREGIPAAVIGRTTAGNDRVIVNEDERRYLDRPKTDQIYCAAVGRMQEISYEI